MINDIERLKTDRDYWDMVAPKGATHFSPSWSCWYREEQTGFSYLYASARVWEWCRCSSDPRHRPLISRPEPVQLEWDGKGMPPVGVEVEYTRLGGYLGIDRVWFWCRVVAHDSGGVVIVTERGRYHLRKPPEYIFRPIRTKEQQLLDEVTAYIDEMLIMALQQGGAKVVAKGLISRFGLEPKND